MVKIKKIINKIIGVHIKKIILDLKYGKNVIFFSIGENCLTDNVLSRYQIKSFSSPYSSSRSNIEYVL